MQKRKYCIKDVCDIQNGYTFRSSLESCSNGNVTVIQMKDLLADHTVADSGLDKIQSDSFRAHHYAKKGDLIFRSRGNQTTSAIVKTTIKNTVVAAPLFRIRIIDETAVIPDYLNWYLGQQDAQLYFAKRAIGSLHKVITKDVLENLEIALPNIEIQKKIGELVSLFEREQFLNRQLEAKRKSYISATLLHAAKGLKI